MKHTGAFLVANEIGLEVNAKRTKYTFMYRDQCAEQNHITRQVINLLKYMGTPLIN
jgi:adenosyl cobinamide kinase/adenosyl cobinamide phosphate guanylyltransferase